jgi:predicted ribosomally synthesized peptide with nif11-like leader
MAMSEEQFTALLAKLKDDAGLQQKLNGAADLDAVLAIAKEAGFDVSKADWLEYQANQTLGLSDEELEGVTGGLGAEGIDINNCGSTFNVGTLRSSRTSC